MLISVLIWVFNQFGLRKLLQEKKKEGRDTYIEEGKSATILLAFSPLQKILQQKGTKYIYCISMVLSLSY